MTIYICKQERITGYRELAGSERRVTLLPDFIKLQDSSIYDGIYVTFPWQR